MEPVEKMDTEDTSQAQEEDNVEEVMQQQITGRGTWAGRLRPRCSVARGRALS